MALPPRPDRDLRTVTLGGAGGTQFHTTPRPTPPSAAPRESEPGLPAELDAATQKRLSDAISKAIAAELGSVRVSSVPPPGESEPPRSSIRVAASVGAKATGKVGKVGTMVVGALAVVGQLIVWFGKPEYAGPIAQALKLIASVIAAAAGGGPPSGDATP